MHRAIYNILLPRTGWHLILFPPPQRVYGRTLSHNQIFSDGWFTKFSYPWCSAGALRAPKLRYYCTFGCACHRTLQIYYRWISWILEMSVIFFNTSSNGSKGNKGGAVVRALASQQCGLGSNPGVNAICGLSLLLVLSLVPRGFSSFSSLLKNQHLQIPIRSWTHGHVWTSS